MPTGLSKSPTFPPLPDPFDLVVQKTEQIPVSIISGFLGSGKSTLINRWLRTPQAQRCAVIVNEFGEIGLDHLLVEHVAEDTVLLNNGCLCCAVRSDLVVTLRHLLERRERGELPRYSRVIIETSGLADCAPIMQSFMTDPLRLSVYGLDIVLVTVDAELGGKTLERHVTARRQLALADQVLVTKGDRVAADKEKACIANLANYSTAPICRATDWPGFVSANVFHNNAQRTPAHDGKHSHLHNEEHCCVHYWLTKPIELAVLYKWASSLLDEFGDDILRIKGLLGVTHDNRPYTFQCVQHIIDQARPLERWPDAHRNGWLEVIANRNLDRPIHNRLAALSTPGSAGTSSS